VLPGHQVAADRSGHLRAPDLDCAVVAGAGRRGGRHRDGGAEGSRGQAPPQVRPPAIAALAQAGPKEDLETEKASGIGPDAFIFPCKEKSRAPSVDSNLPA